MQYILCIFSSYECIFTNLSISRDISDVVAKATGPASTNGQWHKRSHTRQMSTPWNRNKFQYHTSISLHYINILRMQACGMNRNATMGKAAHPKQFNGTALSYQARARASVGRRMMTVKAEKVRHETMCYFNSRKGFVRTSWRDRPSGTFGTSMSVCCRGCGLPCSILN